MYWYFVYEWKVNQRYDYCKKEMDVFKGSFSELILFASKQDEAWVVLHAQEITEADYSALEGIVG